MTKTHDDDINWSEPMWDREKPERFWSPGKKLLKSIRDYQSQNNKSGLVAFIIRKYCVLRHRFWSVASGAEIDLNCKIGGGLMMPHPNGIVIHPDSVIGPNCLIFQQVTLANPVTLEHHVDIGAGAKILGPLTIHHSARVGANAVVTKDVKALDTVVGIPAKSINKS